MSAEKHLKPIANAKQGEFYWREIAKHCDDPKKLRHTAQVLFSELKNHKQAASDHSFDLSCDDWLRMATLALEGSVEGLQELICIQAGTLQHWRNIEFRENRNLVPPLEWDGNEVAKSVLGYDPDIAANVRDDEL